MISVCPSYIPSVATIHPASHPSQKHRQSQLVLLGSLCFLLCCLTLSRNDVVSSSAFLFGLECWSCNLPFYHRLFILFQLCELTEGRKYVCVPRFFTVLATWQFSNECWGDNWIKEWPINAAAENEPGPMKTPPSRVLSSLLAVRRIQIPTLGRVGIFISICFRKIISNTYTNLIYGTSAL